MFKSLLSLIYTDTGKDTSIVFIGTLINIIIGGLFFIIVPRVLGPSEYGLFSTIIATALMVTSIANFGLDSGILRFAKSDPAVIPLAFKAYIYLGAAAAILGLILSPTISVLLNHPEITGLLQIALSCTVFLLLSNFFIAALQTKSQFVKASIVAISSNAARLAILITALLFFEIDLYFLTILFFAIPIVSVVLGKIYLPIKFQKSQNSHNFFKYNLWVAGALIISSIPFDNYLLLSLAGPAATGIYFAPFKILTFVYQLGGNFTRVLASRYSSFDTDEKAIEFSKKSIVFPLAGCLGLIFLMTVSNEVINTFFGSEYLFSSIVLQVLSIGFIFFFLSTIPSSLILYYFGKSAITFIITIIRYSIFILLLILFVPSAKALGAAWAFTLSELLSFLLLLTYTFAKFQKK